LGDSELTERTPASPAAKGGALCVGLRKSFRLRKKEGVIKDFIAGEDFSQPVGVAANRATSKQNAGS
jgi:hypothetical protein